MLKLKSHNYKRLIAACLLAVYLFFSFITIAGYITGAHSVLTQNMQTALVSSAESITNNDIGSYKKNPSTTKKIIAVEFNYRLITLLGHNRLAKIKFNCLSRHLNLIIAPIRFVQKKRIPENSGESASHLLHHRLIC